MTGPEVRRSPDGSAIAYRFPGLGWWLVNEDGRHMAEDTDVDRWLPMTVAASATPAPPVTRCPECGVGPTAVHARSCSSKAGPPMPDGSTPFGGACDMPGCRYATLNVRHVHREGEVTR